jgi:hypothetical protein
MPPNPREEIDLENAFRLLTGFPDGLALLARCGWRHTAAPPKPQLGVATTRELLQELEARGRITAPNPIDGKYLAVVAAHLLANTDAATLDYRTAGHHPTPEIPRQIHLEG